MSDVKRWYVSPRTIELFLRADPNSEIPAGFSGLVMAADYDALEQRCRNLETVQRAGMERSGRIKAAAGALGWTAEREDGPLDCLIAQAQRCRELEQQLSGQLCHRVAGAWSGAKQQRELDDCLSRGIAELGAERDNLRTDVGRLRDGLGIAQRHRDELITEVADLKARLLEAERGAEELVRLRADARVLRIALDRIAARAEAFVEGDACMLPDSAAAILAIARKAMEAAHDEGGEA